MIFSRITRVAHRKKAIPYREPARYKPSISISQDIPYTRGMPTRPISGLFSQALATPTTTIAGMPMIKLITIKTRPATTEGDNFPLKILFKSARSQSAARQNSLFAKYNPTFFMTFKIPP